MTEQNKPAQWTVEFPDFPAADMPTIPAGFEDTSWRNDTCPSFRDDELGVVIVIDYADREKREVRSSSRFTILRQADPADTPRTILDTEEWSEILTAIKIRATEYCHEIGRA